MQVVTTCLADRNYPTTMLRKSYLQMLCKYFWKRPSSMFTVKRKKNNISLKNLLKLGLIPYAKLRWKFHVCINWWELVYICYVVYAKCNADGKTQKNIKKLILLVSFYLNLGKKFESSFFHPQRKKTLEVVGTFLWMSSHSIGIKVLIFRCVQYIQNILLRKCRLFSIHLMWKKSQ